MHDRKKRLGYWSSYLGHTLKLVRGRRREVGRFKNQHISEIFQYFDMKLWIYLDCEIFYHVKSIICSLRPCFDHLGSRLCLWKHLSYPDFGGRRMFSSTIIAVYDELLKWFWFVYLLWCFFITNTSTFVIKTDPYDH